MEINTVLAGVKRLLERMGILKTCLRTKLTGKDDETSGKQVLTVLTTSQTMHLYLHYA